MSTNQQIEIKLGQGQSQKDLDPIVKSYIRVKNIACHNIWISSHHSIEQHYFFLSDRVLHFLIDQDFILFCFRISTCNLSIFLNTQKIT